MKSLKGQRGGTVRYPHPASSPSSRSLITEQERQVCAWQNNTKYDRDANKVSYKCQKMRPKNVLQDVKEAMIRSESLGNLGQIPFLISVPSYPKR